MAAGPPSLGPPNLGSFKRLGGYEEYNDLFFTPWPLYKVLAITLILIILLFWKSEGGQERCD